MTENAYLDWQNYYYEKGETIYVGLYTDSENAQTSSVEVKKIEATQIEGTPVSVTDQILTRGMLNTKGYLYTVPKTGLYTFTNQDTSRVRIKLYMDPSDNIGDTVTGSSPKSLFLKENGVIYVDVMATQDIANVKFTIEYAGEAQALSSGENTITFGGQSSCLTAFTAPDAGLYHFGIAYADALKNAGVWNVVTSKKCNLGSLNKRQRIYLRADKTDQSGDSVSKLALTITRTQ